MGEFRLIEALSRVVVSERGEEAARLDSSGWRLRADLGEDDAAAWDSPGDTTVFTTDTMVEGVHFVPGQPTWWELGWKAMVANQSDVAAMGCEPTYALVTLGLRRDLPVDGLVEMYRGMAEACQRFGGALVGGDVVRSATFFVTVSLLGKGVVSEEGGGHRLLSRSSARPGDLVAVTGSLGCSAGGLRLLSQGLEAAPEVAEHLRAAHFRPVPRVREGQALARLGVRTAMDISDGLVADVGKLCRASSVGALLWAHRVPADDVLRRAFPQEWRRLALTGGEDYELAFTAPAALIERAAQELGVPVTVVGMVTEGPPRVRVVDARGVDVPLPRGGWDHLSGLEA